MIVSIFSVVKNFCVHTKLRKNLFKEEYLRIVNRYLCIWTDKNNNSFGTQLMIQLTSCYRDLSA